MIRIKGQVNIDRDVKETFERLGLGRKYSCIVLNPNKEQAGMMKKLEHFTAFGEIRKDVFEKLIESRGQKIDKKKKIDAKKVIEDIEKGKKYRDLNLKPFFRLHPPRGGINSKFHFPKGVLGNNGEKINELVLRML
jgi:large subunit ribosomal protein L30